MSEGGHWYTIDAKPMHTIIGKNGKERPTTLRDARKLNLYPSVTTILGVQDKPMLTQWLINELLNYCTACPYSPYEHELEKYKSIARVEMRKNSKKAAERGTEIHNKLETYFLTGFPHKKDFEYIKPAIDLIETTFGTNGWVTEATFARNGVGGCVDLHHPTKHIIIDFKTKDKDDINDVEQYDDHKMQLASYQAGLGLPRTTRRFNLFINVNPNLPDERKGEYKLIECTEFSRYIEMFGCLHTFWNLKNDYFPGI